MSFMPAGRRDLLLFFSDSEILGIPMKNTRLACLRSNNLFPGPGRSQIEEFVIQPVLQSNANHPNYLVSLSLW
jgi:hypothetical protein